MSSLDQVEPEQVGFSSGYLAQIPDVMQSYIDKQEIPCVVTLVARHGKIALLDYRGVMSVNTKKPVVVDSIFRIWSMTKPITALAIMMLVEAGQCRLDDPVSHFLPEFKNLKVMVAKAPHGQNPPLGRSGYFEIPAKREITIRDCLTNTTGLAFFRRTPIILLNLYTEATIGTNWYPMSDDLGPHMTTRERIQRLLKIPLCFHPGTDWEYGPSVSVAGIIIEEISGMNLNDFFKENIFSPLGMKDSSFTLPDSKRGRLVSTHYLTPTDESWQLEEVDRPQISEKIEPTNYVFSGGGDWGGVLSTAPDYARFSQMLLNFGELDGVRIVTPKSVKLMTKNHTGKHFVYTRGAGWGSGLGMGVRTQSINDTGPSWVGQYGWGGAAGTHYFADPQKDLLGLLFTQVEIAKMTEGFKVRPQFFNLNSQFEEMVYQSLMET